MFMLCAKVEPREAREAQDQVVITVEGQVAKNTTFRRPFQREAQSDHEQIQAVHDQGGLTIVVLVSWICMELIYPTVFSIGLSKQNVLGMTWHKGPCADRLHVFLDLFDNGLILLAK